MTEAVPLASSRGMYRVTCVNSTAVPPSVDNLDPGNPNGAVGIYHVADSTDRVATGAAVVQRSIKLIPCSTTSASYTVAVYGAVRLVDPATRVDGAQWLWIPLFAGTVAATLAHTGISDAGTIATTEFLPVTITQTAGGPSTHVNDSTNYGATLGPAHALVDTRGCPYLLIQASAAGKFVLVGGYS